MKTREEMERIRAGTYVLQMTTIRSRRAMIENVVVTPTAKRMYASDSSTGWGKLNIHIDKHHSPSTVTNVGTSELSVSGS